MFIVVPPKHAQTLDLIRRTLRGRDMSAFEGHVKAIITIVEVEGVQRPETFVELDESLLTGTWTVADAEMRAAEVVFQIKNKYPANRNFFCTVADITRRKNVEALAVTGVFYPKPETMN